MPVINLTAKVTGEEVPVEEVERTGVFSGAIARIVYTIFTVVAHIVNVVSRSKVAFGYG